MLLQAGPVQVPSVQYTEWKNRDRDAMRGGLESTVSTKTDEAIREEDVDDESSLQSDVNMNDPDDYTDEELPQGLKNKIEKPTRKRKRRALEGDLESAYMEKIEREEIKDLQKLRDERIAKNRLVPSSAGGSDDDDDDDSSHGEVNGKISGKESDFMTPPPMHETLSGDTKAKEIDKSNRTVFLGNVSNTAITSKSAKKTLLAHLSSFLPGLPVSDPPHKLESIRFRSTAYATKLGVPRRAAFAQKKVMDETTHSTNAYAVYSTVLAAQKAPVALNATVALDRHLRVDSVAHPSPVDHLRCVFVGNLDFVNQENDSELGKEDGKGKKKKQATPADVEEGLWRAFNAHTAPSEQQKNKSAVESVRVVRDPATRVGKGFAYIQFYDPNSVEAALLLDGKKFPPYLPRKLRVTRAKKVRKSTSTTSANKKSKIGSDSRGQTLNGPAGRSLRKTGVTKLRQGSSSKPFIFEGHRATTSGHGANRVPRLTGNPRSRKHGNGKPKNRSARRAAAFRTMGGKMGKPA